MTNELLIKAQNVKKEINDFKFIRDYLREPYRNCSLRPDEREALQKKGLFSFIGKIIDNKTKINITPKGWFGGNYLTVDAEFLEYCAKYYDKKIQEKEKEFENISCS